MSERLIGERFERWLGSQRGRVHAELQARFGFEQRNERGAQDRAADGQPSGGKMSDIGDAIQEIREGGKVRRTGWDGSEK